MLHTINLTDNVPSVGGLVFLRAEWWDPSSRFVLVRYSYKGHEEELGLRLDLDKKVFLDHVPGPKFDEEVQRRVEAIWKFVTLERAKMPGFAGGGTTSVYFKGGGEFKSSGGLQAGTMSIFGNLASAIFGKRKTADGTPATGKAITQAEVAAMIKKIADGQSERLDWQQSIVDLMKLLKLDSSLSARKQLAQEFGYKGSLDGSAEMNIWLHKQVMTKLAESGGVIPESLKHA
jgi:hypothetical protein